MRSWTVFLLVWNGNRTFLLVTVRALTRMGSDHTPLLIDCSEAAHLGNRSLFSCEASLFCREGFCEMVKAEWMSISSGATPVERWQNKIRHLR